MEEEEGKKRRRRRGKKRVIIIWLLSGPEMVTSAAIVIRFFRPLTRTSALLYAFVKVGHVKRSSIYYANTSVYEACVPSKDD